MKCGIVYTHKRWDMYFPVSFLRLFQGSEHLKKSFIESFNLAIFQGMVGCCSRLLDFSNGIQLLDQVRFNALALVIVYAHRKPIVYDKVIEYLTFGGSVRVHARAVTSKGTVSLIPAWFRADSRTKIGTGLPRGQITPTVCKGSSESESE